MGAEVRSGGGWGGSDGGRVGKYVVMVGGEVVTVGGWGGSDGGWVGR